MYYLQRLKLNHEKAKSLATVNSTLIQTGCQLEAAVQRWFLRCHRHQTSSQNPLKNYLLFLASLTWLYHRLEYADQQRPAYVKQLTTEITTFAKKHLTGLIHCDNWLKEPQASRRCASLAVDNRHLESNTKLIGQPVSEISSFEISRCYISWRHYWRHKVWIQSTIRE